MKNVLIPTDFSLASLQLAEKAARAVKGQQVNFILFHAFEIPFHYSDLFGVRNKVPYQDLVTDEFRNGCKQLKLQHSNKIKSLSIKHMYGDTRAVFRNWLEANDIDAIFLPDYYVFTPVHPQSVNPTRLFKKSGIPLITEVPAKRIVDIQAGLVKELSEAIKEETLASYNQEEVTSKEKNHVTK